MGIILADNGTSRYSILLRNGASLSEQHAANELQHTIKKISGATLRITKEHDSDNQADSQSQAGLENKAGSQSQPGLENKADSQSQTGLENKADSQSQTGLENKADRQSQPGLENKADRQSQPGLENKADRQSQTGLENKADSQSQPGPDNKESSADDDYEIVLGYCKRMAEDGVNADKNLLGKEGYLLAGRNKRLYIAGSAVRGVLYGVYGLLETLGCRWFTADVEKIPMLKTIILPDFHDEVHIPALEYREPQFFEVFDGDWCARNRVNSSYARLEEKHGGKINYYPFVHSFDLLVPVKEYFNAHPEYFSEVDGRRLRETTQLCLTNPDVLRISIQQIRKWLRERPEVSIVSISPNDCFNPCQCAACRSADEAEGAYSGTLIRFINAISEALEEEFPEILLDTLAYQYTRKPPAITHPRPNVIIRLCSIECCFSHPYGECNAVPYPFNKEGARPEHTFTEDLEGWSRIHDRIYIWDYATCYSHYLMPFPNLKVLGPNMQFLHEHHVKGVFVEGCHNTSGSHAAELRSYMLAKALWNPYADLEKAEDEFMDAVYGVSAPEMKCWNALVHSKLEDVHVSIFYPPQDYYFDDEKKLKMKEITKQYEGEEASVRQTEISDCPFTLDRIGYLTQKILDEGQTLFDAAEKKADSDAVLKRVRRDRLSLRYVQLYTSPLDTKGRVAAIDEFFEDVAAMGITRVAEWRPLDRSRTLMQQGILRSFGFDPKEDGGGQESL